MPLDLDAAAQMIGRTWAEELIPELKQYIEIPALSPAFDADWEASGHIAAAVDQIEGWMAKRPIAGMSVFRQEIEGRTPLVVAEIDPFGPDAPQDGGTTVLYGHLDKQPEMEGWRADLSPWTPVMEGTRLYGRGGADDGYAAFASLAAIEAVQQSGGSHGRLVVMIEASEESGSPDLPAHVEALAERLGRVELVLCLDSGCANYDTLWLTTSLRGLVDGVLDIQIVTEGLHSGGYSGVVPSTFRIARMLLDRVERADTGEVLINAALVDIPEYRIDEAKATADLLGDKSIETVPYANGAGPMVDDNTEALLAKTWRPALSYIGVDGMPATGAAGNVLRPRTALKLSMRIPPTAEPQEVVSELKATLEADPPYGAEVTFADADGAPGWNAPDLAPWLKDALNAASEAQFGQQLQLYGEGGTIPFMGMLGDQFPEAQFVITGVLGPESNAHGPNEFLDVAYAEKLTCCLAQVLDASSRAGLS
jgi:acetylornithine deacetylase/succinyl-diaminopimelate desuccinylase-like protein